MSEKQTHKNNKMKPEKIKELVDLVEVKLISGMSESDLMDMLVFGYGEAFAKNIILMAKLRLDEV